MPVLVATTPRAILDCCSGLLSWACAWTWSSSRWRVTFALRRTLAAQAVQFPELAKLAHEEGWLRGVRAVATLLQQFADRGLIKVEDPAIAADLFLSLVLGNIDKLHGIAPRPRTQELRRQAAVKLFQCQAGVICDGHPA